MPGIVTSASSLTFYPAVIGNLFSAKTVLPCGELEGARAGASPLIPYRIPSPIQYILLDIHPESYKEIDDHRATHCDKRNVDEIFADGGGSNSHLFAYGCAHSEHMPFYKMLKTVHTLN